MNRENLQRLADYLRGPEIAMKFNMSAFCDFGLMPDEWQCGTAACALGHGPAAGITPLPLETWTDYSGRNFFPIAQSPEDDDPENDEWEWCFGGLWKRTDNTPEGAAARIQWLLDSGLPADWKAQMHRDAPLCYRVATP